MTVNSHGRTPIRIGVAVVLLGAIAVPAGPAAAAGSHGLIAYTRFIDVPPPQGPASGVVPYMYIVDPVTGHQTKVAKGWTGSWSPTGRRLAFVSIHDRIVIRNGPGSFVYTGVAVPGVNEGRAIAQVAWSPDGRHIAFTRGDDIWLMDASAPYRPHALTSCDPNIPCRGPQWVPDGSKISFFGRNGWDYINPDGTGLEIPPVTTPPFGNSTAPAWAPDGTAAFCGQDGFDTVVYVGFSTQIAIANGCRGLAWSPDGTQVAFSAIRAPDQAISIVNRDGTGEHELTATATLGGGIFPTWTS